MIDFDDTRDWLGDAVSCTGCPHDHARANGLCQPAHACVHDRYAPRIHRFFRWNHGLADMHLQHPHFEVRSAAARYANVFRLLPLLDDSEEDVRWNAARRLPKRVTLRFRNDPDPEMRRRMVSLLDDAELIPMMGDRDYSVRIEIARRIAPALLARFINDPEIEVRSIVVKRGLGHWLPRLALDTQPEIRLEVAKRMAPGLLSCLKHDPDWRVRFEVASRIPANQLAIFLEDKDSFVREAAEQRGQLSKEAN